MNSTRALLTTRLSILSLALALSSGLGKQANAQSVQHLTIPQPGGMPGLPVMTGITRVTTGVSVTWDGPAGYCQLLQKHSLKDASWQAVGAASLLRQTTVTPLSSNGFFRVACPSPVYAGSETCAECHGGILSTESQTDHAKAFQSLQQINQQTNPACLACHTVGYKLPTGFSSAAATPALAGVQCENCHGPAANHAAVYFDPSIRPRVELAATLCGGCHTGSHQPNYDEWLTSDHSRMVEDMNPASRIESCGRCHSGSARLSLLKSEPLPTGDANMPVVCVVCHDPHAQHAFANTLNGVYRFTNQITGASIVISNTELGAIYTNQLRNPYSSTNDYSITNGTFATQYNPNVNVCAQCHNDRGASWTTWSRPPHHSVQYNILLGTVGELTNGLKPSLPATHSQLEEQCVSCHMQTAPYQSESKPAITGHNFKVQLYDVCTPCHGAGQGQGLVQFMNFIVTNRVAQLKGSLDAWATNAAPAALRSYGPRAWEYATPGALSSGGTGPTNATLQALIPMNIQKARFNLYTVHNDGSSGVHNPFYILKLLDTADAWVRGERVPASDASTSSQLSTTPLTLQQLESAAAAWLKGTQNKPGS